MKFQKTPIAIAAFALFAGAPAVIPSTAHAAPTVSWSAPAAGATITQPINQTHACEVTGTNIKRVVFSITSSSGATTTLNTELSAPWNCILDPNKFASGAYTLRATAYDATSGGASATATRNVNLGSGGTGGTTNTPPSVSVTAPGSGQTVSGASVSCGANATDSNGVARVEFFLDSATTAFATGTSAPYTCSFDSTKLSNGGHTLKATATDSLGAKTTVQRSFSVSNGTSGGGTTNTPPTVSISAPSGTVSGTNVSCAANATDSNGVAQVRFFLDNASTPFATEGGAPYTCSFDSTKLSNGTHTLKAIATDTLGASSTTQVSFSVSNGTSGGTGSGLSFKKPLDGQTISGVFNQQSTCEVATSGISAYRVKFFLNTTALNTEGSAPWQCNLDTRKFTDGVYTLKAQAVNSSGATTGTAQISVRIQNGATNVSPSVSIMKPDAGATLTTSVNGSGCEASATDQDGSVSRVDFVLSNGSTSKPVGSKTAAPYQCAINVADFANGTYTLMAQATDNAGAVSTNQRNLTINKPASGGGGSGGTSPIAAADILTRASADIPFAQQSGYTAQVINTYTSASAIPESGIQGSVLPDGDTLRFGKVGDPTNSTLKALAFQVTSSDPTTSGGKRTELSIQPNIEHNKVYWIAFSVYVHDWGTLSSSDLALFGTQLHQGNNQLQVGGPVFGLYTKQNGRYFRVRGRYSESSTPSASNALNVEFTDYPMPFGRWADFVLKFKQNTSGNGLLQVWMDGVQIADYQGSLGYNTGYKDYAKFGYYNWSLTSMSSTPRKVLLRAPTIVADPTGQTYTHEQLRALVGSSSTSTASTSTSTSTSTSSTDTTTTASSGGVCSTIECAAQ